ncbi:MAG: FAD-dependent oxidoreductase [Gemmatimonadales bacterium]|nr:MAG: FAD-dependent oxidoreductase [Gemmatimonadales bacterium]
MPLSSDDLPARHSVRTPPPDGVPQPPSVAVIGAGVAGLSAARVLVDEGLRVTVFDKGRAPGGRISSRQASRGSANGWTMDHGAQYFTARDPALRAHVASWEADGIVAPWDGRLVRISDDDGALRVEPATESIRWVGVPEMRAVARHLADGLDVRCGVRIAALEPPSDGARGWRVRTDRSHPGEASGDSERFDAILLTPPAPQTLELLGSHAPRISERLRSIRMRPCWAVMLVLPHAAPVEWDGAFLPGPVLSWVARDSSKPGRPGTDGERWVLHATPEWSEAHLEAGPDAVGSSLLEAFRSRIRELGGERLPEPTERVAHRWRFAIPEPALEERSLWDASLGLGVAGDALGGPRVEGAFLSGRALAGRLLGTPPGSPR